MKPETEKTFKVAVLLCLVCSVVVSSLSVGLKDIQDRQKEAFKQQSVLDAARLWEEGNNPGEEFQRRMEAMGIDFEDDKLEKLDLKNAKFDTDKALRDSSLHDVLDPADDVAGIKKVEKFAVFYKVKEEDSSAVDNDVSDQPEVIKLVLPIRGRGLWSTLYGFIALEVGVNKGPKAINVIGLTYYKHGETPGLGGEVENQIWKNYWPGKKVFDGNWNVKVAVTKATNVPEEFKVDALSGATLTSNGVTNMLKFWLGEQGFGPYLRSIAGDESEAATKDVALSEQVTN